MTCELIIGGARSGKSALAERRAAESGLEVVYLATAQGGDGEMARRIAHHQARRPAEWGLVETPLALADSLKQHAAPGRLILVDCLTLWLSNLFFQGQAAEQAERGEVLACPLFQTEMAALLAALPELPGRILLVSNEVGWGIVPMGALTRAWMDEAGRLNQRVADCCGRVTLVVAGQALEIKPARS